MRSVFAQCGFSTQTNCGIWCSAEQTSVSLWAKGKPDSAGHLGDCVLTCHMASPKGVSTEGFLLDILTSESTRKSMTLCHPIFKFHRKPRQTWSGRFLMEQETPPFSFWGIYFLMEIYFLILKMWFYPCMCTQEIVTAYIWGGWSEDREEMQRVTWDFHSKGAN